MPTACSNMFVLAAAWMFLALLPSPAFGWSCELRIVGGNQSVGDALLEAQLKCLREANDTGDLTVSVDPNLTRFSTAFEGKFWRTNTCMLLTFTRADCIRRHFSQAQHTNGL